MSTVPDRRTSKRQSDRPGLDPVVQFPQDRLPPQNIQVEEALLGAILLDGKLIKAVREIVGQGDFWRESHQIIFRAMIALDNRGDGIDPTTVDNQLQARNEYDLVGGIEVFDQLVGRVPHNCNATYHAKIVAEHARRRDCIAKAKEVTDQAYSGIYSAQELADKLEVAVESLRPVAKGQDECRVRTWPEDLAPAAFHGLAGQVAKLIDPHTEADPVAVLVQFLVTFGNIIGRNPHWRHGDAKHSLNLFAVIVGNSSKARKGTSWESCKGFFERCDAEYIASRVMSGLSSGEGLIDQVRDPVFKNHQRVDDGVDDKRALFVESEFGSLLSVMGRDGNNLCGTLRQSWDSGNLGSLSKKSPSRATNAHISVIGHVTTDELDRRLSQTDAVNGFANRFLWVCARRSKILPDPVPIDSELWLPAVKRLRHAVDYARDDACVGDIPMVRTEAAKKLWRDHYERLSEPKPGLLGAITSRAESQVLRIACIYALLDGSHRVDACHLNAAMAVWRYCDQSAAYIFGRTVSDPELDLLLQAIRDAGAEGMSRKRITHEVFGRNKKSEEIAHLLDRLHRDGLIQCTSVKTLGRPAEVWRYAKTPTH